MELLNKAKIAITKNRLHLLSLAANLGAGSLTLAGELPLTWNDAAPFIQPDSAKPFQLNIKASGEIAPLVHMFVSSSTNVTGFAQLAFDLSGTLQNPKIFGDALLNNGTFESLNTGALLTNITAALSGNGDELVLDSLSGADSNGGSVTGAGKLKLNGFSPIFSYNLLLDHILMVNLDHARSTLSGNVLLEGNLQGASLSGSLSADELDIRLPETSAPRSHDFQVTYINQPEGENLPNQAFAQESRWPVTLDIHLQNAQYATISDSDLSSKWHGDINLGGTVAHPLVNGELKILEGTYMLNGKLFNIDQGLITFAGDPLKKTNLYVIVSADIGDIIAEIILKGPIKNPSISFRSNPPMSQKEILSWLLFGHGLAEITPFQGTELSKSLASLKKGGKGSDLFTKLRKSIGIDRIDISRGDPNNMNDMKLQVGKYITHGLFLSVNKSFTAEANKVAIEANLHRNFKLKAEVGDDAEGLLHLRWKHDY